MGQQHRAGELPLNIVMTLTAQIVWLVVLGLPVASISWTLTHEEVFREPREFCHQKSQSCRRLLQRKFFYIFTCEYCLSHYVTIFFLIVTRYKLLFDDRRGYLIGGFALVWIANIYMALFAHIRLDVKKERTEIKQAEKELAKEEKLAA
jgi:hypothetical protein